MSLSSRLFSDREAAENYCSSLRYPGIATRLVRHNGKPLVAAGGRRHPRAPFCAFLGDLLLLAHNQHPHGHDRCAVLAGYDSRSPAARKQALSDLAACGGFSLVIEVLAIKSEDNPRGFCGVRNEPGQPIPLMIQDLEEASRLRAGLDGG